MSPFTGEDEVETVNVIGRGINVGIGGGGGADPGIGGGGGTDPGIGGGGGTDPGIGGGGGTDPGIGGGSGIDPGIGGGGGIDPGIGGGGGIDLAVSPSIDVLCCVLSRFRHSHVDVFLVGILKLFLACMVCVVASLLLML